MIDEIEGVIPTEEEPKPVQPVKKESEDTPHENMGEVTENLRIDETSEEFEDYDDVLDEEEYEELEEDFAEELDRIRRRGRRGERSLRNFPWSRKTGKMCQKMMQKNSMKKMKC